MKETVGLVGVGNMGAPIARRLLDAGYRLRVYNRTAARADALVAAGAERAATPAAAAPRGGVVFSIVADDAALAAVCEGADGIPAGLGAGGAEACALTEKHGVDRAAFVELIAASLFDCPVYRIYGEAVAERRYEPAGFRLALGLKDISLALEAAGARSVPMPMASVVRDRLLSALADGRADQDWTALDAAVSAAAGLAAPSSAS